MALGQSCVAQYLPLYNVCRKMADGVCKKCLKILCLHGYRQSAQTCKEKLGAFRKGLKKLPLEFVYITAPNKIPKKPSDTTEACTAEEQGTNEYGWWFSQADGTYDPLTRTGICKGYKESLQEVQTVFDEQGPFDGMTVLLGSIERHLS